MNKVRTFLVLVTLIYTNGHVDATQYVGGITYEGCFTDDPLNPQMNGAMMDYQTIPDDCFFFCSQRGYEHAGQQGNKCFCSNILPDNNTLVDNSECRCYCSGDFNKYCGCEDRLRVFHLSNVVLQAKQYFGKIDYVGCWSDLEDARDLNGTSLYSESMTLDKCFHYCDTNGFHYAGLQNQSYCFCDNSYGAYKKLSSEQCQCICSGDPSKYCGCSGVNRVFLLTQVGYTLPTCSSKMTCGCWGDPHCYTFDHYLYNLNGRCVYDYISTNCEGTMIPSNLTSFSVRQGLELRPNVAAGSFVEYVEVEVFNVKYRFLKSTATSSLVFTVNGLTTYAPYNDFDNGIQIYGVGDGLAFIGNFGLTVIWNGDDRSEFQLCSDYAGYVCGLCGNANGNNSWIDEIVDRENNPVVVNGSVFTEYSAYGKEWRSDVSYQRVNATDQDGSFCTDGDKYGNDTETYICPNETYYKTSEDWCGLISSNASSLWQDCIIYMQGINSNLYNNIIAACTIDICVSESNITLQLQLKCENYAEFDRRCGELGQPVESNWRNLTGCEEKKCPSNQVYEYRDDCPKTCADQNGTACSQTVGRYGCFCVDGYVQDANGNCVTPEQCGCPMPDGSYIPVGGVVISYDCSATYTCNATGQMPDEQLSPPCSINAQCENVDGQGVCTCLEGFEGDGYNCSPVPDTCGSQFCYAFGDPHYRTQHGYMFKLKNKCSYVLAADAGNTFTLIVDQETRYTSFIDAYYIKQVRVQLYDVEYTITENFYVDGVLTALPYTTPDFSVTYDLFYIKMDTPHFIVWFDGENYLKLKICSPGYTGLCNIQNTNTYSYPFYSLLADDSLCDVP